ncbi:hypothetical protein CAPTEDRAFT_225679 [Capitella teleta]|uniref:carbonic anhydrase n=1 Tax=Capitella teleta TaxID=283909 RepID=R7UU94_CAPTE|nr:hypothetical protein CAPTEDRAFT_225679 [Capitella teleta]|eukprot:ELU09733.1 hypothetical protein CAPTEDRAFT_225679 [Capitella teleta]
MAYGHYAKDKDKDKSKNLEEWADWSYSGSHGPSHWVDDYPDCGKTHQSPINLDSESTTKDSPGDFTWSGYGNLPQDAINEIVNNGHTAKWNIASAVNATVTGSHLGSDEFRLLQFHLHWGSENTKGSEHTLDGKAAAAEIHLVHWNTKYPAASDALTKPDGLAVFGIFIEVAIDSNAAYQQIVEKLKDIVNEGSETDQRAFDVQSLMPSNKADFFFYPGSLTTPGCFESVKWTVFKNPVYISQAQLEEFRSLRHGEDNSSPIVDNFRPVQPLNDRELKRSFDVTTDGAVTLGPLSLISMLCLVIAAKCLW